MMSLITLLTETDMNCKLSVSSLGRKQNMRKSKKEINTRRKRGRGTEVNVQEKNVY